MAGSASDYLENEILDHIFGASAWSSPATLYFGLSTTTITDAGGNITEPNSATGYERVAVINNSTNFPAAESGSKSNGVAIEFPEATDDQGTLTDWFCSDASTGGNIIAYGDLTTAKSITSGDTARFAAGSFTVTFS